MKRNTNLWFVGIISVIVLFVVSLLTQLYAAKPNTSELMIYNPFRIGVNIELKCNWNGKRFAYRQYYKLSKRSKVKILLPHNSKCQLWPHL